MKKFKYDKKELSLGSEKLREDLYGGNNVEIHRKYLEAIPNLEDTVESGRSLLVVVEEFLNGPCKSFNFNMMDTEIQNLFFGVAQMKLSLAALDDNHGTEVEE